MCFFPHSLKHQELTRVEKKLEKEKIEKANNLLGRPQYLA